MFTKSFLRLWHVTFQMLQLHILPGKPPHTSSTDVTITPPSPTDTKQTTVTAPTTVTPTTTITNPTVTETSRGGAIPRGETPAALQQATSKTSGPGGEKDGRVGWIYSLKKSELMAEMERCGLPTEGKVEELRQRFVDFLRNNASPIRV